MNINKLSCTPIPKAYNADEKWIISTGTTSTSDRAHFGIFAIQVFQTSQISSSESNAVMNRKKN
ncbi:hypothetical protein Bhyg_12320, partial [Pseudolycoriella hygida]